MRKALFIGLYALALINIVVGLNSTRTLMDVGITSLLLVILGELTRAWSNRHERAIKPQLYEMEAHKKAALDNISNGTTRSSTRPQPTPQQQRHRR